MCKADVSVVIFGMLWPSRRPRSLSVTALTAVACPVPMPWRGWSCHLPGSTSPRGPRPHTAHPLTLRAPSAEAAARHSPISTTTRATASTSRSAVWMIRKPSSPHSNWPRNTDFRGHHLLRSPTQGLREDWSRLRQPSRFERSVSCVTGQRSTERVIQRMWETQDYKKLPGLE